MEGGEVEGGTGGEGPGVGGSLAGAASCALVDA